MVGGAFQIECWPIGGVGDDTIDRHRSAIESGMTFDVPSLCVDSSPPDQRWHSFLDRATPALRGCCVSGCKIVDGPECRLQIRQSTSPAAIVGQSIVAA